MSEYFSLQYRRIQRRVSESGIPFWMACILMPVLFLGGSVFLATKLSYWPYVYGGLAFCTLTSLSGLRHNEFLKATFNSKQYRRIRLIENAILSSPFVIFLALKDQWIVALVLLGLALLASFYSSSSQGSLTLPTPFSKKPFEFSRGVRRTALILPLIYGLTVMAVKVGNVNLGIFSLLAIGLLSLTFYSEMEDEYHVWIYKGSASKFLIRKGISGVLQSSLLCLPVLLVMVYFFPAQWLIVLGAWLLTLVYLFAMIGAKYSSHPREMDFSIGILLAIGLALPPLLLILIPYFYSLARARLNRLLQ